MSDIHEVIEYWIKEAEEELSCFSDIEKVRAIMTHVSDLGVMHWMELPEKKGAVACIVFDDFKGGLCVNELFMFIKKEHRGNIRLFKKLVNFMENVGRENDCVSVKIGSNIGYNDDSVLKCLQRFGYKTDVVTKEI
jgi:hypothetical protein